MAVQKRNAAAIQLQSSDLIQNQGELHLSMVTVTSAMSPYAANKRSVMVCSCVLGNIVINLPAAASNRGKVYAIKKIDGTANTVTVTRAGADLIDGLATNVLNAQYEAIIIVSDGVSNWWLISLI